jgi:hypothetical protein
MPRFLADVVVGDFSQLDPEGQELAKKERDQHSLLHQHYQEHEGHKL